LKLRQSYHTLGDELTLCRDDAIPLLLEVEKLIFDCDGVIVSDRDSYRQAIARSVDCFFLELVGLKGKKGRLATQEDIQKMKNTGAFNNDWNLTYALITYYKGKIVRLLEGWVKPASADEYQVRSPSDLRNVVSRLRDLGGKSGQLGIDIPYLERMKSDSLLGLNSLSETFSEKMSLPILKGISQNLALSEPMLENVKRLCPFSVDKEDLLRRLFDETYLGRTLYQKFSGKKPFFDFGEGLIDNETRIPSFETLEKVRSRFGLMALYSERPRNEGIYILQKHSLLGYFDERAIFFNEDIMRASRNLESDSILGKPDARAFVALLERFWKDCRTVAYVGDTFADALMTRNAQEIEAKNILFIGTLSSSPTMNTLQKRFKELGVEVIIRDANSIPAVFDRIGRRGN
jgi:phosphoglycolate phosphatase-like HAD superfamily hydrolase